MQSCMVDGQARDFNLGGADCLSSMLDSLNDDLAKNGRFIASLRVNGMEIADFESEADRRLDGLHSIEIMTESPLALARNIIAEGKQFIEGLQDYLVQTAGCYTSGSESADHYLVESVQGMQWFVQMIGFIEQALQLDFNCLSLGGKPVADYVTNLNVILQDIVHAQEKSDPVFLADILEYDLAPHLEKWKEIFTLFENESATYPGQ